MLRAIVTFFASRPATTVVLWAAAVVFGVLSYTVLLPREGFPAVDVPIAVASGAYIVDDADRVDAEVTRPVVEALQDQDGVESIQSFSRPTSFSVVASFESGITSVEGADLIARTVEGLDLPPEAQVFTQSVDGARFLNEFDLLVGIYGTEGTTADELEEAAADLVPVLEAETDVERAEAVELVTEAVDPSTGETVARETGFNLLTAPTDNGIEFRPSIAVGVVAADGVDSLAIRDATDEALDGARSGVIDDDLTAVVAIDFATQIREQVGSLQSNVLTGVIAVSIVALLLISWRASVVTALFIVTVLATTVGVLYLIGISLNTISLFGVILALGLFVDDAIVITESIAAAKRAGLGEIDTIRRAIGRVGTASLSGNLDHRPGVRADAGHQRHPRRVHPDPAPDRDRGPAGVGHAVRSSSSPSPPASWCCGPAPIVVSSPGSSKRRPASSPA